MLEGIPMISVYVQMLINGKRLSMEVDTGAEVSIILAKTREEIFSEEKLRPSDLNLRLIRINQ